MEKRRLGLVVVMAALAAASCRRPSNPAGAASDNSVDHPELTMQGLDVGSYGDGGLQWKMTAPKGEAFTSKAMMRVNNLHVELFQNGQKSTDLTADQGTTYTGDPEGKIVRVAPREGLNVKTGDMYLSGHVVVVSTDGNKLTTDWIHYRDAEKIIVSSAPVSMVRGNTVSQGVGLRATPDLRHVEIFNQTLVIKDEGGEAAPK